MSLYVYPKLPAKFELIYRFFGSGLGNCLFVYARALVFKKKYNAVMIRPTWEQLKMGPILRKENDKRFYYDIFDKSEISGFSKAKILITNKIISEENFKGSKTKGVIKVEGLKDFFNPLKGYHRFIKDEILERMSPNLSSMYFSLKQNVENKVALHIRRGDYPLHLMTEDMWFVDVIDAIKELDPSIEFVVFSDAKPDGLQKILQIKNVTYINSGNALVDILLLSEAKMIVGSNSTFSGWGAFLGNAPIVFERRGFPSLHLDETKELIITNLKDCSLNPFFEKFI